ncbi:unnamed protein product [Cylindrotheca closterium]|uniref:Inositol polyphosphate-related phosphatase domain-containing protein n=1 Tax=Cylindrotheca closterium TaxID=2856 RepID=A0AAD2CFW6_9STRA|nr:unnamed protein product [Cylindrotheca closterium]
MATQDLPRSFSNARVGNAIGPAVTIERKGRRSASRVKGKNTKRRRSSVAIDAKKSTETSVSKSKKRIRQKSSKAASTTVASSEKIKDESNLASRRKRRSKRRKHVAVGSHTPPKSMPVKGSSTKKRNVKRSKKRSLANTKRINHGSEPEETEEFATSLLRALAKDEIDGETPPITDDSKDDPHIPTTLDRKDDDLAPTNIQNESKEEVLFVEVESVASAATNVSDVAVSVSKGGPTTSTPSNDLTTGDGLEDGNAEVSSHSTIDSNAVNEVKGVVNEVDSAPIEMVSTTNVENEDTANKEETENQQVDDEELDKVDVSAIELDGGESIVDEYSVRATEMESGPISQEEAATQTETSLEESYVEAPVDEDSEKKQESEANEGAVDDNDIDSEKKQDGPSKEEEGVVDFIEEILQEDVKSWVNDSSSDSESKPTAVVNDTRGGHQDVSTSINSEVKNDENKSSDEKDSSEEPTEKENQPATCVEDTTITETMTLDASLLEACEDCETDIAVSVVTWNLAEVSPAEEDAVFIRKFRKSGTRKGSGSDLVLISGQECENIKPRRSEGSRSREYRRLMIKMLGKQYVPIALHLLGGIQFGLFAKRSFLKEIEEISIADVTCGIGNVFHNKGAIAAFLKVKARNRSSTSNKARSLRLVFVTAHMAAHVKNVEARNADFWRISSELEAQAPDGFLPEHDVSIASENESFLFNSVDRVFFCGDLNYRVDLPRELTELQTLGQGRSEENQMLYSELMYHDQLKATMCENQAFPGFAEGKISFAPTFKFDKESDSYDTSHKQRIPAWTDRILFKPFGTRVLEYTSVPEAQHSDHRPVHGTFRVSMEGRDLPPKKARSRKPRERRRQSDID